MYNKHRLEALSDGIFAIVMTLLILDLKVPLDVAPGHLREALAHDVYTWVSFGITFFIAARFWVLQHQVFDALENIAERTLITTFVFLGLITVLPFSTSLWGHHIGDPFAFFLYFLNQFAIAAALIVKLEVARAHGHLHADAATKALQLRLYTMCAAMAAGVIGVKYLPTKWASFGPAVVSLIGRKWLSRKYPPQPSAKPSTSAKQHNKHART